MGSNFSLLDKSEFRRDFFNYIPICKMAKKYGVSEVSINNWRKVLG